MSLVKLLVLVLGLVAVAIAVRFALAPTMETDVTSVTEPKRQLDNVRARARELEQDLQRSTDRADVAR